jgi:YaiO family outer membrane protein
MSSLPILLAPLLAAASAAPADLNLRMTTEATNFSKDFGKRRETTLESTFDLGATKLVMGGSHGRRSYADESYSGYQAKGTAYHDWTDRLSSKTSIGAASNSPVFARRELAQDFSYKLLPNTLVTVGARYANYFGDTDVISWSAGASWYFRGGFASYRFSRHDVDKLGNGVGHLATIRLRDPNGSGHTQAWLSAGTTLHEGEAIGLGNRGNYRGVHVQRVQPIAGPIGVSMGVGRTWYETNAAQYHGTQATIGLAVSGWPRL